jgi:hypothetical protein
MPRRVVGGYDDRWDGQTVTTDWTPSSAAMRAANKTTEAAEASAPKPNIDINKTMDFAKTVARRVKDSGGQ